MARESRTKSAPVVPAAPAAPASELTNPPRRGGGAAQSGRNLRYRTYAIVDGGTLTLDMRQVIAVQGDWRGPSRLDREQEVSGTMISYGTGHFHLVHAEYEQVIRDWMAANNVDPAAVLV